MRISLFMGHVSHAILTKIISWPTYIMLVILRFTFVLQLQNGYIHPDEYFQSVEIAAGDLYGLDVLRTWEFRLNSSSVGPVRSIAGMAIFTHLPIWLTKCILPADFMSLNGNDLIKRILLPSRLITVLGSLSIDLFILCLTCIHNRFNDRALTTSRKLPVALLIFASNTFGGLLFGGRTLVNTWETIAVAIFGNLFCLLIHVHYNRPIVSGVTNLILLITSCQSAVLIWASFLRPTFPLFILPFCILEFIFLMGYYKFFSFLFICCTSFVIALLTGFICSLIDTIYYNRDIKNWIFVPYSFFIYNSNSQNVALHGLHSRLTHMFINWPLILGSLYFILIWNLLRIRRRCSYYYFVILSSCLLPSILLSFVPHQEPRFLIPSLPFVCILIGRSIEQFMKSTSYSNCLLYILILYFIQQFVLLIFYGYLHQAGILAFMKTFAASTMNNACLSLIFYQTYMPPRFALNFLQPASEHLCTNQVIDLAGTYNATDLTHLLGTIWMTTNHTLIVQLIYPGSLKPMDLPNNHWLDYENRVMLFPHLSTEDLPSLFLHSNTSSHISLLQRLFSWWYSQLSLHVITTVIKK